MTSLLPDNFCALNQPAMTSEFDLEQELKSTGADFVIANDKTEAMEVDVHSKKVTQSQLPSSRFR